jgi:crotonobetainyl-CoA:carnitine CoA-transferase CaiB-like acyl-CoA transferase
VSEPRGQALEGLRVIDCSTVLAGPGCARYLADFGADVIKVERPETGDTTRSMGWRDPRDGITLFWKLLGRGKRTIVLDLKDADDHATMLRLVESADVLVENFRPGTLERLGLAPEVLHARNPDLVITRITGFGQDGPYAGRPGFATLAEAMSGLAAINGEPDGAPLLPPIALADEVSGLVAAFATMVAVHSGVGQVVDVSLLESLFQLMGPLPSLYAVAGELQARMGAQLPYTVPRNTYRCSDGRWVAVSTSAESVARRVLDLVGVGSDERFWSFEGRVEHRVELDRVVAEWIAQRPSEEVIAAFEDAHAACAPVYDMADLAVDPHIAAREAIVEVDGTPMQGLIAKLSETPGRIRWSGRPLGADQAEVLAELGGTDEPDA